MKEEFVSYQQAKALKECGFDWECLYTFDESQSTCSTPIPYTRNTFPANHNNGSENTNGWEYISAPTQGLAQKWLREVKGIAVCVFPERYKEYSDVQGIYQERLCGWDFEIWNLNDEQEYDIPNIGYRESYESALSHGISQALTLLTEKQ